MSAEDVLLGGRYRLVRVIGRGGMATVYEGHDETLDRPVAVKVLDGATAADNLFLGRFRREAKAAAGLAHPHVVAVYDAGVDGERHYIVMELVRGGALAELLREHGPLPVAQSLSIAGDVLAGLAEAHRAGLVHRDITPGNVLLTESGQAKLGDFGIMRALSEATATQTAGIFGTAAYMSPEQAAGERVGPAGDLYSLGCVLFAMLTGRPPFLAQHPVAVAAQHVEQAPPAPSELRPGIPPAVDDVVLRALAKRPEERFASAGAMRAAVGRARAEVRASIAGAGLTLVQPQHPRAPRTRTASGDAATRRMSAAAPARPSMRLRRLRTALVAASAAALATGLVLVALPAGAVTGVGGSPSPSASPSAVAPAASPSATPAATTPSSTPANGKGVGKEGGKGPKSKGDNGNGHGKGK